jgi:hypothetical protein
MFVEALAGLARVAADVALDPALAQQRLADAGNGEGARRGRG